MTYDFDRVIDRRRTDSSKWRRFGPDVLPLWVADMDFQSPEPVIRALRERVEHGVFGYLQFDQPEFHELVADRLLKRYGWRVSPDAVVIIPGVIPGFNVAGRMLAAPGDGLVLQTPVYPPILRAAGNLGLTRKDVALARRGDGSYEVDGDALAAAIRERTRFLLLCSPHNPVGRVFRRDELQRLAEICLRRGLTIVADRDGQPWLEELLRYLEANRDFAVEYVRTRLPGVRVATPEATYLAWLDCRNAGAAAADPFTFFLEKARVALNDGALFGPGGAGFVRLNFGCPRSLLAEALDRMREALTRDRPTRV